MWQHRQHPTSGNGGGDPKLNRRLLRRWNMSSQHVSSDENVSVKDSIGQSPTSAPCAIANRLSSAHHVRHHSYETTNALATQLFPSRPKLKETNSTLQKTVRSLHRHTSSYALDSSTLNNFNHQHHYSASQENLRNIDGSPSSSSTSSPFVSIPLRKPTPSCFQSITSTSTTSNGGGSSSATIIPHQHHRSSTLSSSSVLNHFNIHNGKLIALIIFFALLFYHGSLRYIKGATSCHRLLNEGRIERYHVWQPTGCMIHWYDLLDFNQCTRLITQSPATIDGTLLATQKAFNNRIDPGEWLRTRKQEQARARQQQQQRQQSTKTMDFRYAFVGDERLYMIYRTFFNTIKYRSNLQRNKRQPRRTAHPSPHPFLFKHNRNVTNSNENFQLQYYSMNTFGDQLFNLLSSWSNSTSTRPHVLVLGLGLFNGLRENGSHEAIQHFEGNLTRIKQILVTNLSISTTIFWFGQPHLYVNEHTFRFDDGSLPIQNEFVNEFINRINGYIDRINHITRNQFYHTNIYWHSSTVLEESSSFGSLSANAFFYDDNNDDYLQSHDDTGDYSSNANVNDESSTTTSTALSTLAIDLEQMQQDDNGDEILFYSYVYMKKNRTILSTAMMNTGKIYEFYKLSSFTRHTCVQILLNALCNPLLLPDDGTCCAQVPPLTRLQFIISILLGCSITFFIVYIVYRIRSVFLLRRKNTLKSILPITTTVTTPTTNNHEQQRENKLSNGHCHMNGAFTRHGEDDDVEAHQQLLTNGHCQTGYPRSKSHHHSNGHVASNSSPSLSTGLSRFRFLIPKFLRNLRKKSREHLLPPLLLTTSIATQSSSCSSGNGSSNNNSSYPSRFYKKKNSLLHFPFTEPAVLRTSVKYAFILLYFYLADRTDFLMKENSHFSRIAFFLPLTYIGILGIFFHDKYVVKSPSSSPTQSSSPNQTPTTSPGGSFASAMNDDGEQQLHSDSSDDTSSRLSSSFSSSFSNNIFLNKEQINEMRGWMMVILLAYQMTDASGKSLVLSMCIQLLISAYLFLSAYGHFQFYWTTGNYQFLPFIQMLFKYNFLTITLCLIMNRHYQSYYYPPLISFYFTLMYVVLGCLPPRIHAGSVKEKPIHFLYLLFKFLLLGILLTILSMSAYLFESIFTFRLWTNLFTTSTITSSLAAYVQQLDQSDLSHNGLHQLRTLIVHVNSLTNGEQNSLLDYISGSGQGIVGPVSMNGISLGDSKLFYSNLHRYNTNSSSMSTHLEYDRNGTINDWFHRWNLDRYTILYGMTFAYVVLFLQNYDTYKTLGIKRKQCQQLFGRMVSILCALSIFGLGAYCVVLFLCSNKAICDEIHPYIVIIPIVSYILLRNMPAFLRRQYSPFFAWFGRISLELFVTQYHIWLVANGHGTLTIIPRMPTLNLLITTFLFVCCCHELHRITNILTPVFVPNDCKCFIRNCLVYILVIVASSYMFSSI